MKAFSACLRVSAALLLLALPLAAQDATGGRLLLDVADPAQSAPIAPPSPTPASAPAAPASAPVSSGSSGGYGWSPSYQGAVPYNLSSTSFGSYDVYYNWTSYYSFLSRNFNMNPVYFSRFYRNTEPLITPEMLKLTLLGPLRLSSGMLDSIDELEAMLRDVEAGKAVDKQALMEKSRSIRALAKAIRSNRTLSYVDLRKERDLYQADRGDIPSLEALSRMREMAVDIDRQLRNLFSQTSTSTVSVEEYSQPSLESLAKGIERICKSIEQSTKRL